jgi:hypothetical protein
MMHADNVSPRGWNEETGNVYETVWFLETTFSKC